MPFPLAFGQRCLHAATTSNHIRTTNEAPAREELQPSPTLRLIAVLQVPTTQHNTTHLNLLKISQYFAYTSGGMFPSGTSSTWAERCELSPCFTHTRVDGMSFTLGGKQAVTPVTASRTILVGETRNRIQSEVWV